MPRERVIEIDGSRVHGISSLYAELNRVFMPGESWTLGESLDALDDLLYGGFGVLDGSEPVRVRWRDAATARTALGNETTKAYLRQKLARPEVYATAPAQRALHELEAGRGETYFDLVVRVFRDHANIELILA
ncbi:barstar family protein [Microbacterium hydrothermale]|uniref:barstar family protein n=1 Tax=Microbacterium hydrothermale TaxID=857427 RepID=UPI0010A8A24A|nr:barstar family protein [Microbacterium hydrothermale]